MIGEFVVVLCVLLAIKFLVYITNARCRSKVCLVGKTALITGGNAGIGFELARELASRGCKIIIADKDDATDTVMKLVNETHNPNIISKKVDFTSFQSVRNFANEIKKEIDQLHILVNNAGMADQSFSLTEDGFQKIMQVNYLSHFLLTHLLLGLILKSAPSRIIYTSSLGAYITNLSEKNLNGEQKRKSDIWYAYGNSKLAGAIMSRMLAQKLKYTGVTSNTYHPGIVKTKLIYTVVKKMELGIRFYLLLIWNITLGKSPEEGVQTLLHLACSNEVKNVTGKFFMECTPVWQPRPVYDLDFCQQVWKKSEEYVKLKSDETLECQIKPT